MSEKIRFNRIDITNWAYHAYKDIDNKHSEWARRLRDKYLEEAKYE